jgi:hypothetical protein
MQDLNKTFFRLSIVSGCKRHVLAEEAKESRRFLSGCGKSIVLLLILYGNRTIIRYVNVDLKLVCLDRCDQSIFINVKHISTVHALMGKGAGDTLD